MNSKERFLNTLDGVLLALAMLWTLTIATQLLHPTASRSAQPQEITRTTAEL